MLTPPPTALEHFSDEQLLRYTIDVYEAAILALEERDTDQLNAHLRERRVLLTDIKLRSRRGWSKDAALKPLFSRVKRAEEAFVQALDMNASRLRHEMMHSRRHRKAHNAYI